MLAKGDTKSSILTRKGLQVDLRVVPLEAWGAAMIYFTGSKAHNIRIREMAVRKGLKLNEYGLYRAKSGKLIVAETEEEVYEKLGAAVDPADAARGSRRGRGRARGDAARRARHARSCAATCTPTPT